MSPRALYPDANGPNAADLEGEPLVTRREKWALAVVVVALLAGLLWAWARS